MREQFKNRRSPGQRRSRNRGGGAHGRLRSNPHDAASNGPSGTLRLARRDTYSDHD